MKYKYVAYSAEANEGELFETFEEAEKWLYEFYDPTEGYSDGTVNGFDVIAKITHHSKFVAIDKKENYHDHTDDCPEGDNCEEEEWPYSDEFDEIGDIIFEEVNS